MNNLPMSIKDEAVFVFECILAALAVNEANGVPTPTDAELMAQSAAAIKLIKNRTEAQRIAVKQAMFQLPEFEATLAKYS